MKRQHRTTPTPERILAAAARVVWRDSVRRLTLEAVAREAQLSKGGVLYHFATKEALIQAMLARLLQSYERDLEGPQQDAEPGRWTRAYVRRRCAPVWPSPGEADLPRLVEGPEAQRMLQRPRDDLAGNPPGPVRRRQEAVNHVEVEA